MAAAQSGSSPRDLRLGQLRMIDLSVSIEHDAAGEMTKPRIEYVTHEAGGLKGIIHDAEAEIVHAEARISRLRRVIRGAQVQMESGVPFPGEGSKREVAP